LICPKGIIAQERSVPTINLIAFIQSLEDKYDVKFSYVDEDIKEIQIKLPNNESLQGILSSIQDQTQIKIQKLYFFYTSLCKFPPNISLLPITLLDYLLPTKIIQQLIYINTSL